MIVGDGSTQTHLGHFFQKLATMFTYLRSDNKLQNQMRRVLPDKILAVIEIRILFELSRYNRTPWFHPYKVCDQLRTEWDLVSFGCEQVLEVRGDTMAFWRDRNVIDTSSFGTAEARPQPLQRQPRTFISLNGKMYSFLIVICMVLFDQWVISFSFESLFLLFQRVNGKRKTICWLFIVIRYESYIV